jgi:DNA-binding transcriptional LysR family regulator
VRLELELADRLVSLQQEGFDLAIRHTQSSPETHVAWPLCETWSFLVASAGYLQQNGTPSHPSEFGRHRCLLYLRGGSAQRWSFERWLPRRKTERVDVGVSGPFKANDSELRQHLSLRLWVGPNVAGNLSPHRPHVAHHHSWNAISGQFFA